MVGVLAIGDRNVIDCTAIDEASSWGIAVVVLVGVFGDGIIAEATAAGASAAMLVCLAAVSAGSRDCGFGAVGVLGIGLMSCTGGALRRRHPAVPSIIMSASSSSSSPSRHGRLSIEAAATAGGGSGASVVVATDVCGCAGGGCCCCCFGFGWDGRRELTGLVMQSMCSGRADGVEWANDWELDVVVVVKVAVVAEVAVVDGDGVGGEMEDDDTVA